MHAAWINIHPDDESNADVRYATFDGEWNVETVAQLDDVNLGFLNARKLVSIATDSEGQPHLAYGDERSVNYLTRNDEQSEWEETLVLETTNLANQPLNGLVVLRLDSEDNPAIAFWRPNDSPNDGIVSLAMLTGGSAPLLGDFNDDGMIGVADIDLLTAAIGGTDLSFDLNGDRMLSQLDRVVWVNDIAQTFFGDADGDRSVTFADFLILSENFGSAGGWAEGDFDGTGTVAFADFLALSENFGRTNAAATVPEPSGLGILILTALCCSRCRSRR